ATTQNPLTRLSIVLGAFTPAVPSPKVRSEYLHRNLAAEGGTVLHGVMEMQSPQDPRPVDFLDPVAGIVERMCMYAIVERSVVIHHDADFTSPEVVFNQPRRYACNAPVRRRVFGVIGSGCERCPGSICSEFGIRAANPNRSHRAPEVVGKLRVPAGDAGVRI